MPAYEYKCTGGCPGIKTFHRSIMDDDPGYACATCNSTLNRVYSDVGSILVGPGFYSTDNRKR